MTAQRQDGYPPNPSFDDCTCFVGSYRDGPDEEEARLVHEALLGVEGPTPMAAVFEIVLSIRGGGSLVMNHENWWRSLLHGESFGAFAGQHRWRDPVAVYELFQEFDRMLEDEAKSAMAEYRRRFASEGTLLAPLG
jgi:hypothetical protein